MTQMQVAQQDSSRRAAYNSSTASFPAGLASLQNTTDMGSPGPTWTADRWSQS